MTPSERRDAASHPDVQASLKLASGLYADHLVGDDYPAGYFITLDEIVVDALEDVLGRVELPTVEEWADGSDEVADREREESLGL